MACRRYRQIIRAIESAKAKPVQRASSVGSREHSGTVRRSLQCHWPSCRGIGSTVIVIGIVPWRDQSGRSLLIHAVSQRLTDDHRTVTLRRFPGAEGRPTVVVD